MQVKEMTDQEGFIADCLGAAGEAALDLPAVTPKQLCFLAFLPNILDTKVSPALLCPSASAVVAPRAPCRARSRRARR